jgi:hypothetical protein
MLDRGAAGPRWWESGEAGAERREADKAVAEKRRETTRRRWGPLSRSRDPHLHLHPGSLGWKRKPAALRDTESGSEKGHLQRGVAGRRVTRNGVLSLSIDGAVFLGEGAQSRVGKREDGDVAERSGVQVQTRYCADEG